MQKNYIKLIIVSLLLTLTFQGCGTDNTTPTPQETNEATVASNKILSFSSNKEDTQPTIADYKKAGFDWIKKEDLEAINKDLKKQKLTTIVEIKARTKAKIAEMKEAEAERLAAEKAEAERLAAEKAEAERLIKVKNDAIDKITAYNKEKNIAPSLQDYKDAGLTEVSDKILKKVNEGLLNSPFQGTFEEIMTKIVEEAKSKTTFEDNLNANNYEEVITAATDTFWKTTQKEYTEVFPAISSKTKELFETKPELKTALFATASKNRSEFFVLRNFDKLIEKTKDIEGIENYYNVVFGNAVAAMSSDVEDAPAFWDGWGGHIGMYGAHKAWTIAELKYFEETVRLFKEDGSFHGRTYYGEIHKAFPKANWYHVRNRFTLWIGEHYNLSRMERQMISREDRVNSIIGRAVFGEADFESEPLKNLNRDYHMNFAFVNAYLKINGKTPRPVSQMTEIIDEYRAANSMTKAEYVLAAKDAAKFEKMEEDHLGYHVKKGEWSYWLRKMSGLNGQDTFNVMSRLDEVKKAIRLAKIPAKFENGKKYWPILDDNVSQRPWHLFALDQGSEKKGCEWNINRFFENDPDKRAKMVTDLGKIAGTFEGRKTALRQRFNTYASYSKIWNDNTRWMVGTAFHPEFSIPTVIRQGGICGQLGTLGQHSYSCLNVPSVGRHAPYHRNYAIVVKDDEGNYRSEVRMKGYGGVKTYYGTNLNEPYLYLGKDVRAMGGERVAGVVVETIEGQNGFEDHLSKSMILQRLANRYPDHAEKLLKDAIVLAKSNPSPWYQLALYYAGKGEEEKVMKLADRFISEMGTNKLEVNNDKNSGNNWEQITAWGIVSSLVSKKTENAVSKSLNFIDKKLTNFNTEGYGILLRYSKANNPEWKTETQDIFKMLLKNNSFQGDWAFPGKAAAFWDNDKDLIDKMKEVLILSSAGSDFKKSMLSEVFEDKAGLIAEISLKGKSYAYGDNTSSSERNIVVRDKVNKVKKLFITLEGIGTHVSLDDAGKEGSALIPVPVVDKNGVSQTLNLRVAKKVKGKFYMPNDSIENGYDYAEFYFWMTYADNKTLPKGVYNSERALKITHQGFMDNTYYTFGTSIIALNDVKIGGAIETESLTFSQENGVNFTQEASSKTAWIYADGAGAYFGYNEWYGKGKKSFWLTGVNADGGLESVRFTVWQTTNGSDVYMPRGGITVGYKSTLMMVLGTNDHLAGKTISFTKPFTIFTEGWHTGMIVKKTVVDLGTLTF